MDKTTTLAVPRPDIVAEVNGDALGLLRISYAYLSDEAHWTRGAWARDAGGHTVATSAPDAVCWCASGILSRAYDDLLDRFGDVPEFVLNQAVGHLSTAIRYRRNWVITIQQFNDDLANDRLDVLDAFSRAIATLEAREEAL